MRFVAGVMLLKVPHLSHSRFSLNCNNSK
ncbi:unnamed protein product [Larinioides sclopetarius]|uniref:Uncharacterized protein n=1 Tax=Larinioides sclopetarius TaxID=280406 RepID=A0AAV1ZZD4_9ARAC